MSAMKIIDSVHAQNGKIIEFSSYCGALPSFEANNNPFGYKFSWSPRGVLLASKNSAKYLKNGTEVNIPGERLFEQYTILNIEGIGCFENYPNRNSLPYLMLYKIPEAKTIYRGTLRHTGWCETMKKISELGYLDNKEQDDISGDTYRDFTAKLIKTTEEKNIEKELAKYLNIETYSAIMKRLEWLGVLSNKQIQVTRKAPLDILNSLMLEKLEFGKNERDMVVLHHEFNVKYPHQKEHTHITSTLINYGIPYGDFAVARTVALPAAVAVKMILEGKITMTGVHIPVVPEIYNPVLHELEQMDIIFEEKKTQL
jgi:saccharopine dehydrogenase-like NADP-dependent oxidoreductase